MEKMGGRLCLKIYRKSILTQNRVTCGITQIATLYGVTVASFVSVGKCSFPAREKILNKLKNVGEIDSDRVLSYV